MFHYGLQTSNPTNISLGAPLLGLGALNLWPRRRGGAWQQPRARAAGTQPWALAWHLEQPLLRSGPGADQGAESVEIQSPKNSDVNVGIVNGLQSHWLKIL